MSKWELLAGLPPYGPPAIGFSATGQGKHREDSPLLSTGGAETWVGNFQPGFSSLHEAVEHPNGVEIVVVAGGTAYVVSPTSKMCIQTFGGQIEWTKAVPEHRLVLFASLTDVIAIGVDGVRWRSRRISWDGLRELVVSNAELTGEAYSPLDDRWHPFGMDVVTGEATGGSYNEVK